MSAAAYDDRDGLIWYDGELVPWRDAKVHLLTHALHYASAVFEGERCYGGTIFKLREHTERLVKGAEVMGFEIPFSAAEIEAACNETCKANGIVDGYVRPIAWRGSEMMGVSAQKNTIHLGIATWSWPSYFSAELRDKGIRLTMSKWKRPSPETIPACTKAAGLYMICTLSKHTAEQQGFNDALMLDYRGYVAEATGENIFLVIDGKLHTPIPDCILNGITRQTIIERAGKLGIEVIERRILPEDLPKASEVFLTGTAAEVTAVGQIDDMSYTVGEITRTIRDDYERLVGKTVPADAV